MTVTSTIVQTLTKIATQRAVVVVAEIETSTTVSTVDVTLSTAATQTNVVWVTSTAVVKRTAASPGLLPLLPTPSLPAGRPQPFDSIRKRLSHLLRGATPIPRQATQAAAPTVTSYVTHTTDITSVSSVIVTTHTTSTYVTTVYQTNTQYVAKLTSWPLTATLTGHPSVLKAETTITITSTLTVTSQPPLTVTLTTTANLNNPTTTPLPSPTSISSPGLPTATIAGIAAGSSTLALFLAGLTIFCLRRHNHSPTSSSSSTSSNKQTYNPMSHRHPTLPHFATTTAPAHHAAEFRLPHAYSAYPYYTSYQDINPQYPPKAGTGQQDQGQWKMGHHQRNSSGVTTLVGSPVAGTFAVAGGGYKGKKEGEDDLKEEEQQEGYGSGLGGERFELDGEGAVVRELDGEGVPKRS